MTIDQSNALIFLDRKLTLQRAFKKKFSHIKHMKMDQNEDGEKGRRLCLKKTSKRTEKAKKGEEERGRKEEKRGAKEEEVRRIS